MGYKDGRGDLEITLSAKQTKKLLKGTPFKAIRIELDDTRSQFEKDLEEQVRTEVGKILSDLDAYNGLCIVGLDEAEDRLVKLALEMY